MVAVIETNLVTLRDGMAFWHRRETWPNDFHNSEYERWSHENPNGHFTLAWWGPFSARLRRWKAPRPVSANELTSRFMMCAEELSEIWKTTCASKADSDICDVNWNEIEAFPNLVATIKPTRTPSAVFTSKFCHFLAPAMFPVVDNAGMGKSWQTYESYFKSVQKSWSNVDATTGTRLADALTAEIEKSGSPIFPGYPMTNKVVELCQIGERHPGE